MADTHAFSGSIPGLLRQIMYALRLAPELRSVFRTLAPTRALPASIAGPAASVSSPGGASALLRAEATGFKDRRYGLSLLPGAARGR